MFRSVKERLDRTISSLAVHGLHFQNVLTAEASDRSSNVHFTSRALADLASDVGRELGIGWPDQPLQRVPDAILREHIQEWRLVQRDTKRRLERVVENRVTGAVHEIGKHNAVFVGEERGAMRTVIIANGNNN